MRKIICFLFTSLLFFSCNNENDVIKEPIDYSIYENMSEEELRTEAEKLGAVTLQQLAEDFLSSIGESENIDRVGLIASGTITVKGYKSTLAFKKNQKVLINKSPTGVPTGMYIVDTYDVRMDTRIPVGYLAIPMDSPKCGLDPNSIGSGRRAYRLVGQEA